MSHTISVRIPDELAEWLANTAEKTGVPQGQIVRDQLEKARAFEKKPFSSLLGSIDGLPPDLSQRKGFSRK